MTVSFWLIILAVAAYGLLHTLLASQKIKISMRGWLGPRYDLWSRLVYNFIAFITLLPILVLPVLLVDSDIYRIRYPWIIITSILQVLSIIVVWVGLRQTGLGTFVGLRQLMLPEDTNPPRLVTGGLYRHVRHPVYTAGLVFIWLLPIMTWNLLALNLGLTAYVVVGAYFEERKLLREFGASYAEYRQRTPMLIPGLRFIQPRQR